MKVVIDSSKIKNPFYPFKEILLLTNIYYEALSKELINQAVLDGLLTFDSISSTLDCTKFKLTQKGKEAVESALLNSEIVDSVESKVDRFTALAAKLRELYPTGRKAGTAYQWRDSIAVIALRLKALVKKYGNCFTDEQAILATKKYVDSFNGNYTYMQLLKYFIMKNNMADRAEDTSQLLAYIENLGEEDTQSVDSGELV